MERKIKDEGIDLKKLFNLLLEKWYLIAASVFICLAVGFLIIKTSPNIFEVYSIMRLNSGSSKTEKLLEAADYEKKDLNIEDKLIEIKSTKFIEKTIQNLDFEVSYFTENQLLTKEHYWKKFPIEVKVDRQEFVLTGVPFYVNILSKDEFELSFEIEENPEGYKLYNFAKDVELKKLFPEGSFSKRFKFDEKISIPDRGLVFEIELVGDPLSFSDESIFFKCNNPKSLVEQYLNKLNLEVTTKNSKMMYMRVGSAVVQKEKAFLNKLMEVVVENSKNEKNQEALKTIEFIDFQLEDVSSSLTKAESDLETIGYTATNIGESSVLYNQRNQLESQIADYNSQIQNIRNAINNLDNIESVGLATGNIGINDPMIETLLIELTTLTQQKANLRRTATDANPAVQRVNSEINSTKEALRNALNGALGNLNTVNENLTSRLNQVNYSISRLPSAEREKLGIQRKFEFSDNTYDFFMQRKADAGIALATTTSDWTIIEDAKTDGVIISPKKKFIFFVSFVLGFAIPVLIILLRDQFDNKIRSKEDISEATPLSILALISKGVKNKKLITQYSTKSHLAESFRDIRINLQYILDQKDCNVIGITSSTSGEGKTFCAVNLGIVISQTGKKVLILDSDLRNSHMSGFINQPNNIGLSNFLIGNCDLSKILRKTEIENLDVVMPGPKPPNPADLLTLPRLTQLISEVKSIYDYIIIDSPPIGLVADYLVLSEHADATFYVVRQNITYKGSFERVNQFVADGKIQNAYALLNDSKYYNTYGAASNYYVSNKKGSFNFKGSNGKMGATTGSFSQSKS